VDANWVPDLVGRAWGNRGNARSRQGKLEAALKDYTTAIEICPWSVDPLLNRGAVLEQMGRYPPLSSTSALCLRVTTPLTTSVLQKL
jgi:tetratricopeptide (TPR) repeat protein